MDKFYKTTKYLWIISRIVLILFFGATLLNRISETRPSDLIVNALFLILFLSMIIISVYGILKKETHFSLSFLVGIFNVLLGVLLSYLLLTVGEIDYAIHVQIGFQLLPLWIILYGIFEIKNGIDSFKRPTELKSTE